jgi:hypothetical protein
MQFLIDLWMVGLWQISHSNQDIQASIPLSCVMGHWSDGSPWRPKGFEVVGLIGWCGDSQPPLQDITCIQPKWNDTGLSKTKLWNLLSKQMLNEVHWSPSPMPSMGLTTQYKHATHGWCKVHIVRVWGTRSHSPSHIMCVAHVNGHCMETCARTMW